MKIVIFGLTVSSSWGNGHATVWRGLCRALTWRGHELHFYERDLPYYAEHRDLHELPGRRLRLFRAWPEIEAEARREVSDADVAIVTSYWPDGLDATGLVVSAPSALRVFYDLDTPVTLEGIRAGRTIPCLGPAGLREFDLVLSYNGCDALDGLRRELGARAVAPLYGSVDPDCHRPVALCVRERDGTDKATTRD